MSGFRPRQRSNICSSLTVRIPSLSLSYNWQNITTGYSRSPLNKINLKQTLKIFEIILIDTQRLQVYPEDVFSLLVGPFFNFLDMGLLMFWSSSV